MGTLDLKDSNSEQVDIAHVFHCDGLLLCTTKDKKLVVWNPCLGETRWIQSKTGYTSYSTFSLGYQNNKSCRSYKILRCWDHHGYSQKVRFEIYEFTSDTWRRLDQTALEYFVIFLKGVSLKGNTFWIATGGGKKDDVLSFDFTTEKFKRWSLPAFQNDNRITTGLSVVRDENLLVLNLCFITQQLDIWVTKKFDDTQAALAWSKYFTVDLLKSKRNMWSVVATAVIYQEKKVVLCCSDGRRMSMDMVGEDDVCFTEICYEEIKYGNEVRWPFIFNYVPSLVHI
ncbi:unnamed protein product [Microthlaspi erraticum]|uniref:F-box associated beta-propeller type 1 domain-containing protein n=1 Tax=Microthlaspi erraticum TaxID=1685480 RepID=A0A6D2HLG0_9BRAS|nr:unnamed protein product [Microthlaspi erraticum]